MAAPGAVHQTEKGQLSTAAGAQRAQQGRRQSHAKKRQEKRTGEPGTEAFIIDWLWKALLIRWSDSADAGGGDVENLSKWYEVN